MKRSKVIPFSETEAETDVGAALHLLRDTLAEEAQRINDEGNPHFPALRSGPTAAPGASLQKQIPSSNGAGKRGGRSPEPGARSPEPGTRSPEPGARSPEPGARRGGAGGMMS